METLCLGCMQEYEGDFNVCPYCGYEQDAPAKEAYHITPGTIVKERYIVGRVLGFGGFGITYIGFDMTLQHKVAIKEYFPSEFATRMPQETMVRIYAGEKREQFEAGMRKTLDEAKRLAEFRQVPGITQIYDFFEENNTAYIVMELLEGETLKERLKRDKRMPVEEALPVVLSVIAALKEVHTKDIIHRDISPDNVYLLKDGQVKLLDFGAARQVTTTHSKSLTVILKLGYAPVEQYQSGGNQGSWTDVYSLAATFYKMITGVRPPESPERRVKDTLKEPSKLGVAIGKNIENALMNALQVRIEDRTKTAAEFENQLNSDNVKRTAATVEKNDTGKWPLWLKAACGLAGAAVLAAGTLVMTGVVDSPFPVLPVFQQREGTVWMPSLVNMSQESAEERLESLGLGCKIGDTRASDTIIEGYVLGQTDGEGNVITPGTEMEKGTEVLLVLSSGSGKAIIPDVVWMDEEAAMAMLSENGLIAVNQVEDGESWAPAGVVTGITPEKDAEVEKSELITLSISSGGQDAGSGETTVPDITGIMESEGLEKLRAAGLYLQKEDLQYSREIPKGQVISQVPSAGQKGSRGDTVKVAVSLGARQVRLVSIVNQEREEAIANLEALGMAVNVAEEYNDTTEEGRVISQSVEPGLVDEGTEVTIVVSLGKEPEQAPQRTQEARPANRPGQNNNNAQRQPQTQAPPQTQPAPPQTQPAPPPQTEAPPPQTQPANPARDPMFDQL
ncbi:PASTA domain-containing protein [Clostridiaceae bacterium]|nr:PASTA domain-containing protein [Clostridiaceae bacterium]RKI13350.1 PASTA domain-containing protein [bacterium 1XD21-70]